MQPRKEVLQMKPYVPPTSGRENSLRLDFNENTLGCSQKVIEAIRSISAESLSIYPQYEDIVNKLSKFFSLSSKQIVLTNGTDDGIKLIIETFVNNQDKVLMASPSFPMYKFYAQLCGALIEEVLYNVDLSFPKSEFISKIKEDTRLIIIGNPNNPTGSTVELSYIEHLLIKAQKFNTIVVIDEAYFDYFGESAISLLDDYPNLIILRTFSKAYGLAALRIGCVIAKEDIAEHLLKAKSPYNVNYISVIAINVALDDQRFVSNYVEEVKKSRAFLMNELSKLNLEYFPTEANFLIVKFGPKYMDIYKYMKEQNILIRDYSKHQLLKECLRVSIGTMNDTNKFIRALRKKLIRKAIIFDMDGVLVDVSGSYRVTIKQTAEYFINESIELEEIQQLKDKGGFNNDWDLTEQLIKNRNIDVKKQEVISQFQKKYLGYESSEGLIDNETWLISKEKLEQLYKYNLLAIATGRPKYEAHLSLEKHGLNELFDLVIALGDYPQEKSKPHPYPIEMVLKGLDNPDAFYIGDTPDDMISANAAGIDAIGSLPPGQADNETLKNILISKGAKRLIKNVNEII